MFQIETSISSEVQFVSRILMQMHNNFSYFKVHLSARLTNFKGIYLLKFYDIFLRMNSTYSLGQGFIPIVTYIQIRIYVFENKVYKFAIQIMNNKLTTCRNYKSGK